jgi:hypothetical protein
MVAGPEMTLKLTGNPEVDEATSVTFEPSS